MGPLFVLLGEVSVQVLCPFFNWVACLPTVESCQFFIHFGDQALVRGIISKYVFLYSWLLFHFMFSLAVQKLFRLMQYHLFILSFISLALGDVSVKVLPCGICEIFLPVFSSRTSVVSSHTFLIRPVLAVLTSQCLISTLAGFNFSILCFVSLLNLLPYSNPMIYMKLHYGLCLLYIVCFP